MRQFFLLFILLLSPFCFADTPLVSDIPGRSAADEPLRRLNFEKEIEKQERKVSLRFHKGVAPKYVVVKYYRFCRKFKSNRETYSNCNKTLESRRFAAWKRYWENQNKRREPTTMDGQVAAGQLEVTLQPAQRETASTD